MTGMDGRLSLRLLVGMALAMLAIIVAASWWRAAWVDGAIVAAMAVILGVVGWRLGRALERDAAVRRQIAAADARLRDAIDNLSVGLLLWDADDRLVVVNPAMARAEAAHGFDRCAPLEVGAT